MRLDAESLSGARGGDTVFSGVSFALSRGQALVVTGPNGAGKTTLLRILAGLLQPAAGRVALSGGGTAWPDTASASHYLGHLDAMKTALSVEENLLFWQRFAGHARMSVPKALETVGLGEIGHLPFGYLSTGQRRRAALARLFVSHRPLWLLDEPTSGLDRASAGRLAGLMEGHLREGGMIVAATHLPLGLAGARELRMERE
ncbi:heme ABC exporter ATP-binding protein CcmA [Chelativorans intermedius]|uniref:Heme ABC exporter ATP-binding protein CcmA n=1 Tax=Chelativorans intermedius TaxID=515947 RepID=A0ABV6DBF0_9HYPH|nr:heme ABC exporter ATP-binding protein CcmA [Chelativorans intermedius]MCT8999346.1 heme ABC exporter ATP-binding protein CcmA [Chelativorans intermedius]